MADGRKKRKSSSKDFRPRRYNITGIGNYTIAVGDYTNSGDDYINASGDYTISGILTDYFPREFVI